MPETMQQPAATAPAAPAAAADVENAQLDARLDLAAKKVALQSLEAQAGGPRAPEAPPPPGVVRSRVVYEADGKTIVLDNPTPEQLARVGIGAQQAALPDPRMITSLTGLTLGAIVVIVWMVLRHLRAGRVPAAPRESAEMQARMARIETAIESVAVEVERMSENQRYAARVLSEGQAPVMQANVPQPLSAVKTNRGGA